MKIHSSIARTTRDSKRVLHVYNLTSKELSTIHNSRGNSLLTLREWILHVIMYRRVFASKPLYVYHNFNPMYVQQDLRAHFDDCIRTEDINRLLSR